MSEKKINKAFQLFQDKKYGQALKAFDVLAADEKLPAWIRLRVKQFHAMAESRVNPRESGEDLTLKTVSFYINTADYDKANELLAEADIDEGEKAFLQAEMAMEQEDREGALEKLRVAVDLNPNNQGYALNSPSFSAVINEEDFQFLRAGDEEEEEQGEA